MTSCVTWRPGDELGSLLRAGRVHRNRDRLDGRSRGAPVRDRDDDRRALPTRECRLRAHHRAGARGRVRAAVDRRASRRADPRPGARAMSTPARNAQTAALEALIEAHAIELKLPTVRRRFKTLAAEALREQQTPVAYLGALLEAEMSERAERREKRRLNDAKFPQIKRLEDFRFQDNPNVPQATIAALAEGSWIDDRESVILVGDSGMGKTMLATAPAVCACPQGRRVRFTTLAGLANELQEAQGSRELARVVGRYARTELLLRRRTRLPRVARRRRRARLPSPLRKTRTRQPDRHDQPAVRRVDEGVPRPEARESGRRPAHPSGAHHRHRQRELALPPRTRTQSQDRSMTSSPSVRGLRHHPSPTHGRALPGTHLHPT